MIEKNSDDLLDGRSTEEIVTGHENDAQDREEPAADVPINGESGRLIIGSVARAERAEQLASVATDDSSSVELEANWHRRINSGLEMLVEIFLVGIVPMIAMLYWYRNWLPLAGLGVGVLWFLVSYAIYEGILSPAGVKISAARQAMRHCLIYLPALLIFGLSFFWWSPDLTGRYWLVQGPFNDQASVYGPGESFFAVPFVYHIRGVKIEPSYFLGLYCKTAENIPAYCEVGVSQKLVSDKNVLLALMKAHPDTDNYLREEARPTLTSLIRKTIGQKKLLQLHGMLLQLHGSQLIKKGLVVNSSMVVVKMPDPRQLSRTEDSASQTAEGNQSVPVLQLDKLWLCRLITDPRVEAGQMDNFPAVKETGESGADDFSRPNLELPERPGRTEK